ncbi:MAG TPA: hypothetical protein DIV79_08460 [Opitutae bacterium]|nr:hypothetical protein [Opitutaceae bacterium]HCR30033.1 hypothetical protein [Opitutae bacterium]
MKSLIVNSLASAAVLFISVVEGQVVADPHRFDEAIEAFEAADRKSMPRKGDVLFLGSSSIRRWDTAAAFKGIDSINRGFGGSQTSDCIYFFDRIVTPYEPSVIVFYEGDNDISAGKTVEQVFNDFQTFYGLVREKLPDTKIVYIPIKPSIKRAQLWPLMHLVNQLIYVRSQKSPHLYYADIATPMLDTGMPPSKSLFANDGLHLSDEGNELWAGIVRPVLEKGLSDN